MLTEPVHWLLGLPFDAIGMDAAVQRIREAARTRRRLAFITPNVNFVAMAARDTAFRDALLATGLSLVDGMPLVRLGRRNGIDFPERVAGSSLLVQLATQVVDRPLRVHLFGGGPGIAERAAARLPQVGPGLTSAGWTDPGFGTIESMSRREHIERINDSGADLLVLALGARNGHLWIAHNHDRLEVPVVSHLGAAVNFISGTLRRAPHWMQESGLEWTWRIIEEPALLGRYWSDGLAYLRMRREDDPVAPASAAERERQLTIVRAALEAPAQARIIDAAQFGPLDARALGLLYTWRFRLPGCATHRLVCSSPDQLTRLRRSRAECLLTDAGGTAPGTQ